MNQSDIDLEIAASECNVSIVQRIVDIIVADAIHPLHLDKPLTQDEFTEAQWQLMRTLRNQKETKLVKVELCNCNCKFAIRESELQKLTPATIELMPRKAKPIEARFTTSRWNWAMMHLLAMSSCTSIDDVVWNLIKRQAPEMTNTQGRLF